MTETLTEPTETLVFERRELEHERHERTRLHRISETLDDWTPPTRELKVDKMKSPGSDLLVRRALTLFRERPGERWTVTSLARCLGTSRPVLARRFVEAIGVPPLRALTLVRMERAAELLETTEDGLASIADAVGYDSEFAFSRAFRRHKGVRPGQFRRGMSRAPVALAA